MSFVSWQIPDTAGQAGVSDLDLAVNNTKFPVSHYQRKIYNIVCSLAVSKHSRCTAVDIGQCTVKYFSLGESMAPNHEVCTFVINCMCRKFFLDERPTISRRHYFFSSVPSILMSDSNEYEYVKYCFNGASSVLRLQQSSALLFPVLHCRHWFVFIVDLSRKMFLIMDSLFSKDDEFSVSARRKLIPSFCHAWRTIVCPDFDFSQFRLAYPHVPKQDNKNDCGVFVIKFLELWSPTTYMPDCFSQEDIPSIRIQIVDELLNSPHNKADLEIIRNY